MASFRVFAAVLAGALALSSDAGVVYRFTRTSPGALSPSGSGRVWIDEKSVRLELDPDPSNPRAFDVALSVDGKMRFLNLQNETWFDEQKHAQALFGGAPSKLFHLPWPEERLDGPPRITHRIEGPGRSIGGHPTTKHVIQVAYRLVSELRGTSLRGDVESTITLLVAPALPRGFDRPPLRAGIPPIDDELQRQFDAIEGLVLDYEISVGCRLEGGPRISELSTIVVTELTETNVPAATFRMPDFQYQPPVVSGPGR